MQIFFVDDTDIGLNGDIDFSGLQALGEYRSLPNGTEAEIIEHGAGTEIIAVNKAQITAAIFEALTTLRLVAVTATGYNNVDLEAARAAGVTVSNVAGYAGDTVPQHAFALILNLATKAYKYAADVERGDWQRSSSFTLLRYPAFELKGLTIGIVGFGVIGRGVARIAEGFGMRVLANDAFPIRDSAYDNTPLDELLAASDFVTIHSPLTEQTRNLIDAAALAKMKPTAYVINTARGGIVDEEALAEALYDGRLAGAGFDVLTEEPPVRQQPVAARSQHHPHPAQRLVDPRSAAGPDRSDRHQHPLLHRRHPPQRGGLGEGRGGGGGVDVEVSLGEGHGHQVVGVAGEQSAGAAVAR